MAVQYEEKSTQLIVKRIANRFATLFGIKSQDYRYAIGAATLAAHRANPNPRRNLWDYECKIYSQWGEDGILDYIFDSISVDKPRIVEFGVGDFSECNSRFSAEHRNAKLFLVDSKEELIENIRVNPLRWKTHIEVRNEWITPITAEILLTEAFEVLGKIDCFSLDIDGNDFWVAKNLDFSQIKVIVVEYNPIFGCVAPVSVPRDDNFNRTVAHFSNLYYGASLMAWINLFKDRNFSFIGSNRVGNNAFFINNEFKEIFHFDVTDLKRFVDWNVRESRDEEGCLTYVYGKDRFNLISHLPVVNTLSEIAQPLSTIRFE